MNIPEQIYASEQWRRLARLKRFALSQQIFVRNTNDLRKYLKFLTEDPRSFDLLAWTRRGLMQQHLEEVLRYLQNFVASATLLVDHSRVLYRDLYERTGELPEYKAEVRARFADVPLVRFVHEFRNYFQHFAIPSASITFGFNQEIGMYRKLMLYRGELLKYSGWKRDARNFLLQADENIDLVQLVVGYEQAVLSFYDWFDLRKQTLHSADLEFVNALWQKQHEHLRPKVYAELAQKLVRRAKIPENVEDLLSGVLTADDYVELLRFERDREAWLVAALRIIEQRFGTLPVEVCTTLEAIAHEPDAWPRNSAG